jgi:hypothetical protein
MKNVIRNGVLVAKQEDVTGFDETYTIIDDNGGAIGDIWDGQSFKTPPRFSPENVKAAAYQRIISFATEHDQRNLLAEASDLSFTPESLRTQMQIDRAAELRQIWGYISDVRQTSKNFVEMTEPPLDWWADIHWPTPPQVEV